MTPEQKAREEIDRQFAFCGWIVSAMSSSKRAIWA
jgi:hypothetical protein